MGFRFLLLLLLFVGITARAQSCHISALDSKMTELKLRDSVYKVDVHNRTVFFAFLNQEILPKHSVLKSDILSKIDKEDYLRILKLKREYQLNNQLLLDTVKHVQKNKFQNLSAYSILNNVLLKELFDAFPDSYALLLNPAIPYEGSRESTLDLYNSIAAQYSSVLSPMIECFTLLESEINTSAVEFGATKIFQGRKSSLSQERLNHIRTIDMLLWAIE